MGPRAGEGDERKQLRLLVEATPSAIVMIDERGNVALTNARAQQLFGYPAGLRKDGSEVAIEIGLNPITTTTCSRFHGSDARRWRERR